MYRAYISFKENQAQNISSLTRGDADSVPKIQELARYVADPIYPAPEIFEQKNFALDKADVYSYALLLLEIFTQEQPFKTWNWSGKLNNCLEI